MHIEPVIKNNVIETKEMVQQIFENKEKENKVNLAYSAEEYIANSLAMAAIEKAEEMGIKSIVIAGGCAYNEHITLRIKEKVEMEGMKFFIGKLLPCGDGGISFGQAIVANEKMKRHY
jgi:hydrogenase maturation protein HypF